MNSEEAKLDIPNYAKGGKGNDFTSILFFLTTDDAAISKCIVKYRFKPFYLVISTYKYNQCADMLLA